MPVSDQRLQEKVQLQTHPQTDMSSSDNSSRILISSLIGDDANLQTGTITRWPGTDQMIGTPLVSEEIPIYLDADTEIMLTAANNRNSDLQSDGDLDEGVQSREKCRRRIFDVSHDFCSWKKC